MRTGGTGVGAIKIVLPNGARFTAAESWENAIKPEAQDYLENARFNCADRHQASVQQAFNGVTVTHVFVGYGEDEVEDMIQKS